MRRCEILPAALFVIAASYFGLGDAVRIAGPGGQSHSELEQHTPISLTCEQLPTTTKSVTFKRGNKMVEVNKAKGISVEFFEESTSGKLVIAEAEESDSGNYSCAADDQPSDNQVHVHVTGSKHPVSAARKHVQLAVGLPLNITCMADIHTHVEWFKGKSKIALGSGFTMFEKEDEASHLKASTLAVSSATAEHEGVYVCQNEHHEHDRAVITVSSSVSSGRSSVGSVTHVLFGTVSVFLGVLYTRA